MVLRRSFVVHLGADMHSRAKEHCRQRRVKLKDWVEELITRELMVVSRKEWAKNAPRNYDEPWAKPPFWDELKQHDSEETELGGLNVSTSKPPGD